MNGSDTEYLLTLNVLPKSHAEVFAVCHQLSHKVAEALCEYVGRDSLDKAIKDESALISQISHCSPPGEARDKVLRFRLCVLDMLNATKKLVESGVDDYGNCVFSSENTRGVIPKVFQVAEVQTAMALRKAGQTT